jgi:hypothetical protein
MQISFIVIFCPQVTAQCQQEVPHLGVCVTTVLLALPATCARPTLLGLRVSVVKQTTSVTTQTAASCVCMERLLNQVRRQEFSLVFVYLLMWWFD